MTGNGQISALAFIFLCFFLSCYPHFHPVSFLSHFFLCYSFFLLLLHLLLFFHHTVTFFSCYLFSGYFFFGQNCYFFSCFFISIHTVAFFPVTFFLLLFFPTQNCSFFLLPFFLLLSFWAPFWPVTPHPQIPGKKITKNAHMHTTNESILLYILKLGGQIHICQFETIPFAI